MAADAPVLDAETGALLSGLYGPRHRIAPVPSGALGLVLSCEREIDLIELEQLCDAVGWSRRPVRRVRKALTHSLLRVGLWRHDPRIPKLVGFARCTGDGVVEATVWDVAVHPHYQGAGLGKQLALDMPVSRHMESEADLYGLELAARGGYDPRAAITLWQKMAQQGGGGGPSFLSTHPSSGDRMAALQNAMPRVMPLYEQARARR